MSILYKSVINLVRKNTKWVEYRNGTWVVNPSSPKPGSGVAELKKAKTQKNKTHLNQKNKGINMKKYLAGIWNCFKLNWASLTLALLLGTSLAFNVINYMVIDRYQSVTAELVSANTELAEGLGRYKGGYYSICNMFGVKNPEMLLRAILEYEKIKNLNK